MPDPSTLIGWLATLILMGTIGRQVYTQWRDRTAAGVSHWLFIGQFIASLLFTGYSMLKSDPVFIFTNSVMTLIAIFGYFIDRRNRRSQSAKDAMP